MTGVLTLEETEDGSLTGRIIVIEANIDDDIIVDSLEIDKKNFTLMASVAGTGFTLIGTVDGDSMVGENDVVGIGVFTLSATRRRD